MLLGAILSVFASILDGCDGEVARLKLQDSAFGCWLETVCDYLYYVFIFAGMIIGLLGGPSTWSGARALFRRGCQLSHGGAAAAQNGWRPSRAISEPLAGPSVQTTRQSVPVPRPPHRVPDPPLLHAVSVPGFRTLRSDLHGVHRRRRGANIVWPIALYSYSLRPGSTPHD